MARRRWAALVCALALFSSVGSTAHARDGGTPVPLTASVARGGTTEPDAVEPPLDVRASSGACDQAELTDRQRDNRVFDIVGVRITSDCRTWTVTTRLARPIDAARLNVWEFDIDIDDGRDGCKDIDRIIVAERIGRAWSGRMLVTPRCSSATWTTLSAVPVTQVDDSTLQVTFTSRSIGNARRFGWRAVVDATGEGGTDAAPDRGFRRAWVPPTQPTERTAWVKDSNVVISWEPPIWSWTASMTYDVRIVRVDGSLAARILTARNQRSATFRDLNDGVYTATISARLGPFTGTPGTVRFSIPLIGPVR